jgi:poly-gamma-glutamate capsule biosynthesis protein CapA/YwtB (metallophosphatase superfamily)
MRLAIAGDTMLGRGVAQELRNARPETLVSPEVSALMREADLAILNLECCISERGEPWPAPGKPFFFRAPPRATDLLQHLGVDCVTLANNHALDFGYDALLDTFAHLDAAGIRWVGAGPDLDRARAAAVLETDGFSLTVLAATDHPADYAARQDRPGVALFDPAEPDWLAEAVRSADTDAVLVTPHWGPNMVAAPVPAVRSASGELERAGASLVAGHSAHVFHGVHGRTLFDLGDFLDDYRVDPALRNDLSLLWLVTLDGARARRLEAVPLKLEYAHTRLAEGADAEWVERRFVTACRELGTKVVAADGRLTVSLESHPAR